jgi:uncharacterized lipoprotein YbaY
MEDVVPYECVPVPHFNYLLKNITGWCRLLSSIPFPVTYFYDLPSDLLKEIAGYCGIHILMQFKKTCKKMNEEFGQDSIKRSLIVNLEQDGILLKKLPDFQDNHDIVLAAVSNDGRALEFASSDIRDNHDIVSAAVRQNGKALQFASLDLRNNRDIVLAAVRQYGFALHNASATIQNNNGIVLVAVSQDGWALKFASTNLQNDHEIVLAAVRQDGDALKYASTNLQNDPEILLAARQ